jgi:hypothetical protein
VFRIYWQLSYNQRNLWGENRIGEGEQFAGPNGSSTMTRKTRNPKSEGAAGRAAAARNDARKAALPPHRDLAVEQRHEETVVTVTALELVQDQQIEDIGVQLFRTAAEAGQRPLRPAAAKSSINGYDG